MKKIVDPSYRAAKFLATLRQHGMRNIHESRLIPNRGSQVLQRAARPA